MGRVRKERIEKEKKARGEGEGIRDGKQGLEKVDVGMGRKEKGMTGKGEGSNGKETVIGIYRLP